MYLIKHGDILSVADTPETLWRLCCEWYPNMVFDFTRWDFEEQLEAGKTVKVGENIKIWRKHD